MVIAIIFIFQGVNAQSISPDVIASAGTFAASASGSMSWTIGELMTETYSSTDNFFTQGFHQPEITTLTAIPILPVMSSSVYPNPLVSDLHINLVAGNYSITVYDMQGQLLKHENVESSGQLSYEISFNEMANGVYLLNIINSELNFINSYKVTKAE